MRGRNKRAGWAYRVLLAGIVSSACALGGLNDLYTSASEDQGTPPKVRFDYQLSPGEEVNSVEVKADGVKLVAELVSYTDDPTSKTAVLFLIDTSNPRRNKEVAEAKKLVMVALSKADKNRHTMGIYPFHGQLDEGFAPMGTPLEELKTKAKEIKANELNTVLYGSVLKAIGILQKTEAKRKAIVVISDWKSEDNVMDAKEFVALAVKQLKDGKIVCHSIILVEEDQSELDTAEKLSQVTGGQLVKVSKGKMAIPSTFTDHFLGQLESGGSAVVDLGGREKAAKLVLEVETKTAKKYSYEYDRATKLSKAGAPVDPKDPKTDPQADPGKTATVVDPSDPASDGDDEQVDDPANATSHTDDGAIEKKGNQLLGLPIWMVIAALAVVVLLIIGVAFMVLRNKEDDVFDEGDNTQMMGTPFPGVAEGAEDPAAVTEEGGTPPSLPDMSPVSPYPEVFELGNGTATCNTLPGPDETVVASLESGVDGSRGTYPISKTAVRIGRGSDNDLSLKNDSVSRHHAEILCKRDGSFVITDLDSGNGIFVNDEEVSQKVILTGDKIEIGEVTFTFHVFSTSHQE